MRLPIVWTIFRKEITEALRDRVTLLVVFGLPILLYPLLILGITKVQSTHYAIEEQRASKVVVWGTAAAPLMDWLQHTNFVAAEPWTGLPTALRRDFEAGKFQPPPPATEAATKPASPNRKLSRRERLAPATHTTNTSESPLLQTARKIVNARDFEAVLIAWPGFDHALASNGLGHVSVYYDSVRPASQKAGQRLESRLDALRAHLLKQREGELGLQPGFTRALETRVEDLAPPQRQVGNILGLALPFLLITLSAMGALYPAIDLTAGEKDRATMQTLLCAPVRTFEIAAGKFLAVWTMSLLCALANTGGLGLSLGSVIARVTDLDLSPATFALAFVGLVPVTCTIAAMFLAVAALGRDVKDAGNFLNPTLSLLLLPMSITMLPGIELNAWTSFVPLVNVALLIKALFIGEARAELAFLTFAASSLYAMLGMLFAARAFSREQILLGGKGGVRSLFTFERSDDAKPTPALALVAFAIVMVAGFYGSLALKDRGIAVAVLFTQYGCFLLPVVGIVALMKFPVRETFSLRRPRALSLVGCVLLGISAGAAVAGIALRVLPPPESLAQDLEKLIVLGDPPAPLWKIWLVIAITPAVCEELVFRGLILSGFRRLGMWPAILASALLFGLAHASIYRLLPTFALGVVLGFVAWRTGSIACSILIHALNNGLIATLVYYKSLQAQLGLSELTIIPWSLTLTAIAVLATGLLLLQRPPEAVPRGAQ